MLMVIVQDPQSSWWWSDGLIVQCDSGDIITYTRNQSRSEQNVFFIWPVSSRYSPLYRGTVCSHYGHGLMQPQSFSTSILSLLQSLYVSSPWIFHIKCHPKPMTLKCKSLINCVLDEYNMSDVRASRKWSQNVSNPSSEICLQYGS